MRAFVPSFCGALVALVCAISAQAQTLQNAWVSAVMDGDTVLMLPEGGGEPIKLRVQGIDAPEICQAGGVPSRQALVSWVLRRNVRVQVHGHDSYGRALGQLWVDAHDVGAQMVRSGMAWAYSFRTGRGPYAALQREAERERKGLFAAQQRPMSPALFRQFNGPCHDEGAPQAPVTSIPRVPHTGQAGSR